MAEIAKGLTKASRLTLLRQGGAQLSAKALFDAGLFAAYTHDYRSRYSFLSRITPLGEAVTAAVTAEARPLPKSVRQHLIGEQR